MATQKTLDQRRGAVPDIRVEGDSLRFYLDVAVGQAQGRLTIRCDADGNVSVAIVERTRASTHM